MFYADTSVLVAAATIEKETKRVQQWLTEPRHEVLAISDWVETEFSSAVSIKIRHNLMTEEEGHAARRLFRLEFSKLSRLPVPRRAFVAAAGFAAQFPLGLRGGDALHLGIADHHGVCLCTLDKRQADAGAALGVKTLLI